MSIMDAGKPIYSAWFNGQKRVKKGHISTYA